MVGVRGTCVSPLMVFLKKKGEFANKDTLIEFGMKRSIAISGPPSNILYVVYNVAETCCWPLCDFSPQLFQLNTNTGEQFETILNFMTPNSRLSIHDHGITAFNELMFVSNRIGNLMAYHIFTNGTGNHIWTATCPCLGPCANIPSYFEAPFQVFFSPMIFLDPEEPTHGVVVTGIGNQICTFDIKTGTLLWSFGLYGYIFGQPTISLNGDIFVSTISEARDSFLVAL